jgi:hypothetical protein
MALELALALGVSSSMLAIELGRHGTSVDWEGLKDGFMREGKRWEDVVGGKSRRTE